MIGIETKQTSYLLSSQTQQHSTMSAETADLTKVDSAVSGLSSSPTEEKKIGHRRASSSAAGVYNINDLGMSMALHTDLALPPIQHDSNR